MANVLFTRKNASEIPNVPITDGQLIFDTSGNGKMYLDNGTDRLVMGGALTVDATLSKTSTNPVQNKAVAGVMLDTLSDISNVTSKGFLTDALAVKQLNTNVNELNNSLSKLYFFDTTLTGTYDSSNNNTVEFEIDIPSECPFTPRYVFSQVNNVTSMYTCSKILDGKIKMRVNSFFIGTLTTSFAFMLVK